MEVGPSYHFKGNQLQVLERGQTPRQDDVTALFRRFQAALAARGLTVAGITTDGSDLYPPALAAVFGPVPHQVCEFHSPGLMVQKSIPRHLKKRKAHWRAAQRLQTGFMTHPGTYPRRQVCLFPHRGVIGIDMTYIRLRSGWLYLVAVLDWHSRDALSWELDSTMTMRLLSPAEGTNAPYLGPLLCLDKILLANSGRPVAGQLAAGHLLV